MKHIILAFVVFLSLFAGTGQANTIVVEDFNSGVTAGDLVNSLLGENSSVVVSNITVTGANLSIGKFTSGETLGFDTGIVMSTGNLSHVPSDISFFADTDNAQPGDSDLDALVSNTTYDAVVLEFDFIPEKSNILFNYRLSSEENFSDVYDDAFGLFVNDENIALLPDGNNVSVTVTNIGYGPYYEAGPLNTCFNGSSIILTASTEVLPNTLNHMKFAIADARDPYWDSAVFIEAGSFVSNTLPNTPETPLCEGETNPTNVSDLTPEFSWTFSDSDVTDTQSAYQIQVSTSAGGNDIWDSDKVISSLSTDVSYAGSTGLQWNTTYYWRVKIWDNNNGEGVYCENQTFVTSALPVANFTTNVTSGTAPLTVSFTDQSLYATGWLWDFGDGNTSTDQNSTHIYTSAGNYTVNFTVTNIAGSNTSTQVDYITVTEAPVATTVNASYTSVTYNENDNMTVDSGINVSGSSTFTSARVYIGDGYVAGEDFLRFTNTSSINGSFISSTGILSLSGSGSAADYQEAFRNVRYENINDNPNTSDRNITFVMGDNAVYLESTGHYYESVHSEIPISWTNAKAAAEARSLSGMQGYLATILTEEESLFLGSKAPDNAWIGATDEEEEGVWRWVTGPDNGTIFYYRTNDTTLQGLYSNWNREGSATEPNDWDTGEDHGQILGATELKKWNDLPNAADVSYYLVEYGGMPDETAPQLTATITVNINPINDAPSTPGNFTSPLSGDSVERGSTINVSWGGSTDPENDTITYDLWYLNGTWAQVADMLGVTSFEFTIPFDDLSEATFKVYANDSMDSSQETNVTFTLTSITPDTNFTGDVTSGLVPLTVNFTDHSSNYPTGWVWNFGDGNTSTEQNPVYTYYAPGTYNISLNASNLGGYNTTVKTAYITAAYVPIADLTADVTSGAVPLTVNFTDQSANNPTSWEWDFGDGNTSTDQNPIHTYTAVGTYTVSLNATNVGGSNIITRENYIASADVPVAGFTSNVTFGAAPLAVSFTDQSTNATAWHWEFGDGTDSTEQNPTHVYAEVGTYNVSLTAINTVSGNDSVTETDYIAVAMAPVANLTSNVTSGAVPLSVSFTDQSTNTPTSWFWDFGDGTNSTEQNPTHIYSAAGSYTVSLNATNIGGSNTNMQTDYITAAFTPVANFSSNVTSGAVPLSVSFTDLSANDPASWFWDFGDGTNSTEQNVTHTYTSAGIYNVSLNATNLGGSNISMQIAYITAAYIPVAGFTSNVTSGAAPLAVSFTDQSTNATGWHWEFGDGNDSTEQNPTHIYTEVGSYNVSLTAINAVSGNDSMTETDYITVAIAPVANFTADLVSGTAPLTVSFTDNSANTPTSWSWDFGDGAISTSQNPTHIYTSAGTYNVSLNASNAGGYNVSTLAGYVSVTSGSGSSDSSRRASVSPGQQPESVTSTYTSVKHVMGGTKVEYDLSGSDSPVLGISFDAKDNEGVVVAKVQVLSERPEGVSVPPGRQYQLMSIDVGSEGTISSHNADNIRINFKVSWDWIRENNIDPVTIRMTRFHDGEWQELPTGKVSDDGEFLHFVAETPGFSVFSVVGDKVVLATQGSEVVPEALTEEATDVSATPEEKNTPGFTILTGLAFVSLAFLVSRKFRQ